MIIYIVRSMMDPGQHVVGCDSWLDSTRKSRVFWENFYGWVVLKTYMQGFGGSANSFMTRGVKLLVEQFIAMLPYLIIIFNHLTHGIVKGQI